MKIQTITVTGADDSITHADMEELSAQFPCIEFGILLSRKQQGSPRFPSKKWLQELQYLPPSVKLSGHLCGSWVREIFMGDWPMEELERALGKYFFNQFGRWQLNTHGQPHEWSPDFIRTLSRGPKSVIFQYDGVNNEALAAAERGNADIAALFDLSHGAGLLPDKWPKKLHGTYCGYAGGLSPENVSAQCAKIASVVGEAAVWIDAETHLRSEHNRVFDLEKVRAFLANALPYTA